MTIGRPKHLGDLLPLSAITGDGVAVRDDGSLVAVLELRALAPLRMSSEQLERAAAGVGELAARLPDRQCLQLITEAEPLATGRLVGELHADARDTHRALAEAGLEERGRALEALALTGAAGVVEHCERLGGVALRHLLVVAWNPPRHTLRRHAITAPAFAHAREEHAAHLDGIVAHLQSLDLAPRQLDGPELAHLLHHHLNPDSEHPPGPVELESLLGPPSPDPNHAQAQATELRAALCRSRVDDRARSHLLVGGMAVHGRAVTSVPDHTWLGWLFHLMQSPYPFVLSVRWQAGRRASERQRARHRYRRIWGVQRSREIRGRPPDPEASEREDEAARLQSELAASAGAGVFRVGITLSLRHPDGDAAELARHARELERELLARTDARLHHPRFAQLDCWRSTWPLALDPLKLSRRYASRNLADTTPLIAARCGSPSGDPLGWARPGRTLERLDPFDPTHENHLMVVCGKSGGGKTMATNLILARILAQGAQGGVIDRAGHYEFLAALIPGAAVVNLGARDGQAINPWDTDGRGLGPEKLEYLLALHSFFLGRPQPDGTYDLEPRDHSQLSLAIRAVYRRCRLTGELPRETLLQEELYRRAAEAREDGNVELASHLGQLAEGLHDYTGQGAGAYLADRPTSVPEDSPLVIFDTREVGDARAGAAMFEVVEHLTRRSARTRQEHADRGPWGGRTFLVVDEGWKLLERRSTGRWINEQARRSRHNRLFLLAISQKLSDFLQHPEGEALVSQSSIQLLLGQLDGQTAEVQRALGLTDEEAQTISGLRTVKGQYAEGFLCNGRRGRGLIEIRAGAAEYWIATSEPDHDQPLRRRVLAECGGDPWAALEILAAEHQPRSAA